MAEMLKPAEAAERLGVTVDELLALVVEEEVAAVEGGRGAMRFDPGEIAETLTDWAFFGRPVIARAAPDRAAFRPGLDHGRRRQAAKLDREARASRAAPPPPKGRRVAGIWWFDRPIAPGEE